jgi:transcriptional regulator with XRE-family HTH domain
MGEGRTTGARLRDRRQERGLRQADLARRVGISPSYLNLIEHGRRRIGGKLMLDLAAALGLDPAALSEGGEAQRAEGLRAAAHDAEAAGLRPAPETARAEDLAERFPGWTALILHQSARIEGLARRVTELAGRLSHDHDLARSLHQVLSGVTAIRSAAGILADSPDLDRDWRERFLRNIRDDSEALADATRALVRFLEAPERGEAALPASPAEEAGRWLDARDHRLTEIERGEPLSDPLPPGAAGEIVAAFAARYAADAEALPLGPFAQAAREAAHEPAALARAFGQPLPRILRRLATLPPDEGHPPTGLAIADASGTFLHLKPLDGLSLPRSGACPLWPVHEALTRPGRSLRMVAALPGQGAPRLLCHAIAALREEPLPGEPPVWEATMLVRPAPPEPAPGDRAVGPGCRLCPRPACPARREPSILR